MSKSDRVDVDGKSKSFVDGKSNPFVDGKSKLFVIGKSISVDGYIEDNSGIPRKQFPSKLFWFSFLVQRQLP